jgi:Dolichyl-phosphate-mannose-protein mannosyltransferase
MPALESNHAAQKNGTQPRVEWAILLGISAAVAILHIATNGRYGFHRDELQFLSDARHLHWGFVCYPPLTPFIERIGLSLFGLSMVGLRVFSVLAQAAAIVVTGLTARELGGRRLAQFTAALAVALSGLPMFEGTEFQYSTFDYLWWVLIAYFTVRLLKSDNPRWWLAIGAVVGVGLLTKYSIVFYIAGILTGMLLSRARRHFTSGWFWGGIAVALVIFLPNFLWLVHHDFVSYRFLQHIHARDVAEGRADGFLIDQGKVCINLFAVPLCLTGLVALLRSSRYRMVAWMYLVPFALFYFGKGRGYYVAGAYPMLVAMGAAASERWLAGMSKLGRRVIEGVFFAGVVAWGVLICAIIVPLATSGPLRDFALKNNGDLREEIGWDELVHEVAGIRDSLPAEQRASLGITVGNYGEYGAIEMLGPAYNLPHPIGTNNSEYLRGYPVPPPATIIVLGLSKEQADSIFTGCRLAGHNGNAEGIQNEESLYHPDIFVCGPPHLPWEVLWKDHQDFG